jgi:glycosyltransferase involved in cell wall biosynthesis
MPDTKLKVLMISSDRKILAPGSAVAERMKEYADLVQELHIILLSDKSHGLRDTQLASNLWVYPTNSIVSVLRPLDAARLGNRLVLDRKFVRGLSLLTADSIECGWAGQKIKSKWRVPLEVQIHNDPFSPYYSGFQNWVRKFHIKKVLKNADSIRVVSEQLKVKIGSYKLEVPITVLPIYVDREKIEEGKITFDLRGRFGWNFVILTVARLEPEKNVGLALEVLALVRQRYPEAGLVIVGSGSEENALKRKARSLDLGSNVVFEGWQESMSTYYKTANVLLQPSKFEGYSMTVVEAGLSGLPVITTPVGIAMEFEHGREAYIYPATNPELFAEGVIELIENNSKRESLRSNMKVALESKLIIKSVYLERILQNWVSTASKINA